MGGGGGEAVVVGAGGEEGRGGEEAVLHGGLSLPGGAGVLVVFITVLVLPRCN